MRFFKPNVAKMEADRNVLGLISALKDSDTEVRRRAAQALEKIGDARAVEPFIAALKDSDIEVRRSATRALENSGSAAVEPLVAALKDSDARVRFVAAKALGEIRDARVVEPFIAALKDSDIKVRFVAANALGQIGYIGSGDVRVIEPLVNTLYDSDHDVRYIARMRLDKIGWRPTTPKQEKLWADIEKQLPGDKASKYVEPCIFLHLYLRYQKYMEHNLTFTLDGHSLDKGLPLLGSYLDIVSGSPNFDPLHPFDLSGFKDTGYFTINASPPPKQSRVGETLKCPIWAEVEAALQETSRRVSLGFSATQVRQVKWAEEDTQQSASLYVRDGMEEDTPQSADPHFQDGKHDKWYVFEEDYSKQIVQYTIKRWDEGIR